MNELFDKISASFSRRVAREYSTSFSVGIYMLARRFHRHIYAIYGFVRLADEIVDSFHGYPQKEILDEFRRETWLAIDRGVSIHPVLHSFQFTVKKYSIEKELIETFFQSMEMDLERKRYESESYRKYILGSAEVVGLMCLRVFTEGDREKYERLKPAAMKLGSAFQKVNFLRDFRQDRDALGRIYFPGLNGELSESGKRAIEADIEVEFYDAFDGVLKLPPGARLGVYVAFTYYFALFSKIRELSFQHLVSDRVRIGNTRKLALLATSVFRHALSRYKMPEST